MAMRTFKFPYVLSSALQTTPSGQLINGGALQAGETRNFPENAYNNALDRPFWVTHCQYFVGRVAGGGTVDSDYENVAVNLKDLVRNEDITKDPVALSVLGDREHRRWILAPGQLVLRRQGGGMIIKVTANPGAGPFNVEFALHGYTEVEIDTPESYLPERR